MSIIALRGGRKKIELAENKREWEVGRGKKEEISVCGTLSVKDSSGS